MCWHFILVLLLQHKLRCVNLIGRRWRTYMENQANNIHIPSSQGDYSSRISISSTKSIPLSLLQTQQLLWSLDLYRTIKTTAVRSKMKQNLSDSPPLSPTRFECLWIYKQPRQQSRIEANCGQYGSGTSEDMARIWMRESWQAGCKRVQSEGSQIWLYWRTQILLEWSEPPIVLGTSS